MAEIVKFGLIGKEDFKVGRSTFEATLADGRVVQLNEVNLDSFDKLLSVEDSTASAASTLLTLRHTTTGTPAAGLATKAILQAESADENPCDVSAIEGVLDDVTAGSEDSTFYVHLRTAGAALARAFGFRNTGGSNVLFTTAASAARTITIPDATTTLVGTDVSQTLTNKTLTNPLVNGGGGTDTLKPAGLISTNITAASTTAVTSEEDLISYTLPADSFDTNGQTLHIIAAGTCASNANVKTIRLYFDSDVLISNDVTTTPNGSSWFFEAWVTRASTTTQKSVAHGTVGAVAQTTTYTGNAATEGSTITIKVTGQNGTASSGDITAQFMHVSYHN